MKDHRILLSCCLAAAVCLLIACGEKFRCPEYDPVAYRDAGGLRLAVALDKAVYGVGEPVSLTISVSNISDAEWTRTFPDAGIIRWDVYRGREMVFTWNRLFGTAAVITEFSLAPGESKTYVFDSSPDAWDQKDDRRHRVSPGEYEMEFRIHELPEPYRLKKVFCIE